MLNRENVSKWVAALRSGKYKQGQRTLATPAGEFCCLGVACEVAAEDGVVVFRNQDGRPRGTMLSTSQKRVMQWLGLNHIEQTSLASLNDSGASFEEIAERIERLAANGQ